MIETRPALPFQLVARGDGTWRGYWSDEKLVLVVGGPPDAPAPALVETLRGVVSRWSELKATIATFARGLASDHHVPLDPPSRGGFAARTCGFDLPLTFQSVAVTSVGQPDRLEVTFYTGEPDGYASYAVVCERGVPTAISAFAS